MMLWNFLLAFYIVYGDVIRDDGYNNYGGQFTVKHRGRMLRVLMFFRNIPLEECALHCVRHLRCKTYNYCYGKKDCELTDEDFDKINADTISLGWYNYGTPKRVNGAWSTWTNYTSCTKSCGGGTVKQYRECDSPKPQHGGSDCRGKMRRRINCNTHGCPVHGNWGAWKSSSSCSQTCGGGTYVQTRECDAPTPQNGGNNCAGAKTKTVGCNTHACPVHGNWGAWKSSSSCSQTCGGGTYVQTRECDAPTPQNGGNNCAGEKTKTVGCNTHACPVHGNWGAWKSSSSCSQTCGGGTYVQTRECDAPTPQNGGNNCAGAKTKTVGCNTHACPVHGNWGAWTNSSSCSKTCGGGTYVQTRECDAPTPQNGGKNCAGEKTKTVGCNTHACPVHGNWGAWTNSSSCSQTCGGGTLEQKRECNAPAPQHGGDDCTGDKTRTVVCIAPACPVVNVALGKAATQSSTFLDGMEASNAVDENTDSYSCTTEEKNPWWKVDLGEIRVINNIRLNANVHSTTNKGLKVETRENTAAAWKFCYNIGDVFKEITEFKCNGQITNARFIKIRSTKECYLRIEEVELFGY